jgi:hypothetical protein
VRNIDEEQWSLGEHEHWRKNVSINFGFAINDKRGDFWIVGFH